MAESFKSFMLTEERVNALLRNRPHLVQTLILHPMLFSILRADRTLSENMEEEIKAAGTKHAQICKLLDLLRKRGNNGFNTFINALVETDQDSVAMLLDQSLARQLITERDSKREPPMLPVQVENEPAKRSSCYDQSEVDGSSVPPNQNVTPAENPYSVSYPPVHNNPNLPQWSMPYMPPYMLPHPGFSTGFVPYPYPPYAPPWFDQQGRPLEPNSYPFPVTHPMGLGNPFSQQPSSTGVVENQPTNDVSLNLARGFDDIPRSTQSYDVAHSVNLKPVTTATSPVSPIKATAVEQQQTASAAGDERYINYKNAEDEVESAVSIEVNSLKKFSEFLNLSILEQKLRDLSLKEKKSVLDFINAVCDEPSMKFTITEVKNLKEKDQDVYRVRRKRHSGLAVIIGNKHFYGEKHKKHETRLGMEHDKKNLKSLFEQLNFFVVEHVQLSAATIKAELQDVTKKHDLKNYDILLVFIMSHGIQGQVFGTDCLPVKVDEIVQIFDGNNCEELRGKPKLFFFQACQGDFDSKISTDGPGDSVSNDVSSISGQTLMMEELKQTDNYKPVLSRPNEGEVSLFKADGPTQLLEHQKAHIFIAYAAYRGFKALRHPKNGSFFVRSLVYVFANYAHEKHIGDLFAKVNQLMSFLKINDGENPIHLTPAQIDSTLEKELFLYPGYDGSELT